jgi:hypothetical protein
LNENAPKKKSKQYQRAQTSNAEKLDDINYLQTNGMAATLEKFYPLISQNKKKRVWTSRRRHIAVKQDSKQEQD